MPSTLLITNPSARPPQHSPSRPDTHSLQPRHPRHFPITRNPNDIPPLANVEHLRDTLPASSDSLRAKQHTPVPDDFRIMTRTKLNSNDDNRPNILNDPSRPPLTRPPRANRPTRTASIVDRQSSLRQTSLSSNASTASTATSSTNVPIRKRTSLQPQHTQLSLSNPQTTAVKAPRRSMLYAGDSDSSASGSTGSRTRGLVNNASLHNLGSAVQPPRPVVAPNPSNAIDGARLASARASKATSLMPPTKSASSSNNASTTKLEHSRSASFAGRSPNKIVGLKLPPTPSSVSRRMSTMPGMPQSASHATGLGARTISPTDTRRAKRMSMVHGLPVAPHIAPVASIPHDRTMRRNSSKSPSMLPRKTPTPASSRTTPDPNRKSYSSGQSSASTASFNTARTSTGLSQPRNASLNATSRLPTAKTSTRNVHSSAGNEEDEHVPPVPAIPKAYESPKDSPAETPFFTRRKSGAPVDSADHMPDWSTSTMPISRHKYDTGQSSSGWDPTNEPSTRQKVRTPTMAKNLQPLRLPPLNLLPLSTPTSNKATALRPDDLSALEHSTPISRRPNHTPSTPMTASKVIPPQKQRTDMLHDPGFSVLRSVSSVNTLTNTSLPPATIRHVSGTGQPTAVPTASSSMRQASATVTRRSTSPFVSSSLPKSSSEFSLPPAYASRGPHTPRTDQHNHTSIEEPKTPSTSRRLDQPVSEQHGLQSVPSSSSSTSLRRKLSMGWKRSASKSSINLSDIPPPPPKHGEALPSYLPSSSTTSSINSFLHIPSPASLAKSTSHPDSKKSRESASTLLSLDMQRARGSLELNGSQRKDLVANVPDRSQMNHKLSSTVMSSAHKMLHSKPSSGAVRTGTAELPSIDLDRDDMVAEEEMRKLSSKRRETEIAARQLDSLRRRAVPREAASPQRVLDSGILNIYERGEIVDYNDIYFTGTSNAQKHIGDLKNEATNFGYDDERGDYSIVTGDHLSYRYEIVNILGKGSFGQVVRCVDHKTGGLVAIKIIRNKKRFHQQALVEVNILKLLREWDPQNKHSMVSFTQSFYFRGHLCISTELLDMNLYEFIKANNFKGCSTKLIRRFTKQMLSSLTLLKQKKVIHCDLKPENILLTHPLHSEIKVIDFGSSCFENEKVYTYIQSRFYRSPEVILGMTYGLPIDMWSLGCILAELYTGYPIFPGENEQEQLACIMEVFGPPEKHLIEKSTRKKLFFDSQGKPRLVVSSKGRRRKPSSKTLAQALKCEDEAFLDFLARCMRWDPDRRLRPEDAIRHEFITKTKSTSSARPPPPRATSPLKRFNTIAVPPSTHHSRPLPEPPTTSFKNGVAVRQTSNGSPTKPMPRRQSNMTSINPVPANSAGVAKRTSLGGVALNGSTGSNSGSALPRVAHRVQSGGMAGAGASAAFRRV